MFVEPLTLSSVILIELSWGWQNGLSESRVVIFHCWFNCFVNLVNYCRNNVIFNKTVQIGSLVCSRQTLYRRAMFSRQVCLPSPVARVHVLIFPWHVSFGRVNGKKLSVFFWQGKAVHVHHFAITWQGKPVEKLAWPGFGEGSLSRKTWYSFLYTVANKACQRKLVDQNLPVCTGFQVRSLLIVLLYSHVITSATVICSRQL